MTVPTISDQTVRTVLVNPIVSHMIFSFSRITAKWWYPDMHTDYFYLRFSHTPRVPTVYD